MRQSRKLCLAVWLLFFSALLLGCTSVAAEGRTYRISEAELERLEESLSELSSVNGEQREKLMALREKLRTSETRLEASERNSKMLSVRLDWLSKELTEQTALLESANKSLQEYEREARRTRSRLERQRNTAYVLAAIAVAFCIAR